MEVKFSDKIIFARRNKGLTQSDAAKLIGISSSSLSRYERGIADPYVHTVRNMAIAYEIPIDFLFSTPK